MSDKEDIKLKIEDSDFGMGGIDRFNSETGETEIIRQPETDRPFTIGDYNKALADYNVSITTLDYSLGLLVKEKKIVLDN